MPGIQVMVSFHGYIRDAISEAQVRLAVASEATFADLFKLLADKYGDKFRERLLAASGELHPGVAIFAGDRAISDVNSRLADEIPANETVSIMVIPMITGGNDA